MQSTRSALMRARRIVPEVSLLPLDLVRAMALWRKNREAVNGVATGKAAVVGSTGDVEVVLTARWNWATGSIAPASFRATVRDCRQHAGTGKHERPDNRSGLFTQNTLENQARHTP